MNEKIKLYFKGRFRLDVQNIAIMGVLMAMQIVLSDIILFQTGTIKIGFGFVPIMLGGILLGPLKSAITCALADLLGVFLFSSASIHLGFTLTAFLVGLLYGFLLYKKQSVVRLTIAVLINQFIFTLLVNSYWIAQLRGIDYKAQVIARLVQIAIMIPVMLVTGIAMCNRKLKKLYTIVTEHQ